MSIKHLELVPESGKPFANCKLGREKYAKVLTGIVNGYSTGFVLAINNRWGTGKTTFIKMWKQDLEDESFRTVYFNAWENDFEDNPLIALMGELNLLTKDSTKTQFSKALKSAAALSKKVAPVLVQAVVDKYIDTKMLRDVILSASEGFTDVFVDEVNEYANKKKSIKDFKENLTLFINKTSEGKPLIFIIDELDRCRPNYAVSILEQIKHFFSVPNIIFVLAIDKIQLGNAVRGVYGSDNIDSDEYLRRFIDIEYSIPEPEKGIYYKYLYEYFGFDEFFNSKARKQYYVFDSDGNEFLKIAEVLFEGTQVTLRQQEKIFAHARLALRSFQANTYVIPIIYLLLIYIRVVDEALFNAIKSRTLTVEELQQNFLSIIKGKLSKDRERELMRLEAYLILYYHNSLNSPYNQRSIYFRDETCNKLLFKSAVNPENEIDFLQVFEHINSKGDVSNLTIDHFLKRIELTVDILT